jgi:hypothetical protein
MLHAQRRMVWGTKDVGLGSRSWGGAPSWARSWHDEGAHQAPYTYGVGAGSYHLHTIAHPRIFYSTARRPELDTTRDSRAYNHGKGRMVRRKLAGSLRCSAERLRYSWLTMTGTEGVGRSGALVDMFYVVCSDRSQTAGTPPVARDKNRMCSDRAFTHVRYSPPRANRRRESAPCRNN